MKSKKQQSAWLLAGAAAGIAAAWFGRQKLQLMKNGQDPVVEPSSAELPLGASADPDIDEELSRRLMPQDDTTGAALLGDQAPESTPADADAELDEIFRAELAEPAQTEGYDSIAPEDLGAAWLERATQALPEPHHAVIESGAPPVFEDALMSEASITSALAVDEELEELERLMDEERGTGEVELGNRRAQGRG